MSELDDNTNSLPKISLTSYILGILSGLSITLSIHPFFKNFPYLTIYLFFISLFHFLEYFITAKYQPNRVNSDSFVLNNPGYHVAHLIAFLECLLELYFFPNWKKSNFYIKLFGLFLMISSQLIRSLAMITAGRNFSHIIKNEKEDNHILITHGIYKFLRHPSYFGFFYWALGTQLLLLNPISFIIFAFLLYDFFASRIPYEEANLLVFFGDDYKTYKSNVPIGIPFIKDGKRILRSREHSN
jgi:protein-S-isoprenylcysteine O-methyltransferase